MVGKRVLQGKYEMTGSSQAWNPDLGDHFGDLPTNLATLATNRRFSKMRLFFNISIRKGDIQNVLDITTSQTRVYKRRQMKGGMSSECEEGLWSFVCSVSWKAGELSTIERAFTVFTSELLIVCVAKSESAVTVITSELLSVCVANLYRSYCTCYLCFVFFLNIWE
ncbi:hypothetical protein AVEN_4521-1 [Araneus ventricosus]|uniref:Uncharacterized protein n=1 Tax=Araneus ventricosus TaxID=182803 RepID=A0A4Y2BKM7_ARAVE|nr:hypothetical protein AVEN_4521-1 [Araneus ventricosus]